MKKVSTYLLIGIEIFGIILITQQRYMYYKLAIFCLMAVIAIAYFCCETFLHLRLMDSVTDIICCDESEESDEIIFSEEDLKTIEEIKDKIEAIINE